MYSFSHVLMILRVVRYDLTGHLRRSYAWVYLILRLRAYDLTVVFNRLYAKS